MALSHYHSCFFEKNSIFINIKIPSSAGEIVQQGKSLICPQLTSSSEPLSSHYIPSSHDP